MKSGVTHALRRNAPQGMVLAVAIASLSGCMGSPTYGTDKPADQQLLEDITGVLSLAPKNDQRIEYKPRPELVKPASLDNLPPPQDDMTTASNPDWPESPEQRRARLRADATANRDNMDFSPEVVDTRTGSAPTVERNARGDTINFDTNGKNSREEFNRRLAENKQGSATSRRYLSEPPTEYRKPIETAPVGDVGEEEWRKEQRRKDAAGGGSTFSWRNLIPGF